MSKGQLDIIIIPIMIFILIVSIFVGVIILKEFMGQAQIDMPEAWNKTTTAVDNTVSVFDILAPFIFVGFGIVMILTAYLINSHPLFYIVGLFSTIIGVITTAGLSNALNELNSTSSVYTGTALSVTKAMIPHLPKIVLAIAIIGAIALYSKSGGTSGGV